MANLGSTRINGNLFVDGKILGDISTDQIKSGVFINDRINKASIGSMGIVQLNTSHTSADQTTAATPSAVKAAYDLANSKLSKTGGDITGNLNVSGFIKKTGGGAGFVISKGTSNTMIYSSSVDGEHIFGGNNSGNSTAIDDYIRVGKGKLGYSTGGKEHRIYSEAHKPRWEEVLGKPTEFPSTAHDHNSSYYTKSQVDSSIAAVNARIDDLRDGTTNLYSRVIATNEWVLDSTTGMYECVVTHNLNTTIDSFDVSFYDSNNSSAILMFDYVDGNSIKLYNDATESVKVVVSGVSISRSYKDSSIQMLMQEIENLKAEIKTLKAPKTRKKKTTKAKEE